MLAFILNTMTYMCRVYIATNLTHKYICHDTHDAIVHIKNYHRVIGKMLE